MDLDKMVVSLHFQRFMKLHITAVQIHILSGSPLLCLRLWWHKTHLWLVKKIEHPKQLLPLCCWWDEGHNHPIEVVKEGKKVESQFDPSLTLALREYLMVHNAGGVIQAWTTHDRAAPVPVDVVEDEGQVEEEGEYLASRQEEDIEEHVQ